MPNLAHVLVHSLGNHRAGYIVQDSRELARLELSGAIMLPVDEDLAPPNSHSALDGFFIKSYGVGWLASKGAGERCCPMVLRVHPDRNHIHWVARVTPVPGLQATGRIRLAADTAQPGFLNSGLSPQVIPDLIENQPIDKDHGWTLRGESLINVSTEGMLALSLYAVTKNVRVQWVACSLTSHGTDR